MSIKIVFLSALIACGLCFYLNGYLKNTVHPLSASDKFTVAKFDSRSMQAAGTTFKMKNWPGQREIRIFFDFCANEVKDYENLFQTDPVNSGMRMELSSPAALALIIKRGYLDTVSGMYVDQGIEAGKWYRVAIEVDRFRNLRVSLNDNMAVNQRVPDLACAFSDVAVGTGFSKTRPFNGTISNFSIEVKSYKYPVFFLLLRNILALLSLGAFLLGILLLFFQNRSGILEGARRLFYRARSAVSRARLIVSCPLEKEHKVSLFCLILTLGFFSAVVFHYIKGMFWSGQYPANTFLPGPLNRYCDFYSLFDQWVRLSLQGMVMSYLPSVSLILGFLSLFTRNPYPAVAVYLSVFCLFFVIYAYKNMRVPDKIDSLRNIVAVLMSYPFLFTFHTGNMESYVFIFLCLFVYFYSCERSMPACICLAMAVSMKIYPVVFLVLMASDRKYRQILHTLFWIAVFTILPLVIFSDFSVNGLKEYFGHFVSGQKIYKDMMIFSGQGNRFGHSLLNGLRVFLGGSMPPVSSIMTQYFLSAVAVFGLLSAYIIVHKKIDLWKKTMILVICMDILPYTSTDYKLIHLFIPLFLYFNSVRREKLDLILTFLLALLFVPKNYYIFPADAYYTLNIVLNPLIMLFILLLVISTGFRGDPVAEKVDSSG